MTEPTGKEDRLIEEITKKLFDWTGGGFNTNTRMSIARARAIELISDVRRATT